MPTRRVLFTAAAMVAVVAMGWFRGSSGGSDYIVKRRDNICGLRDASKLSHPARVDHPRLVAATPEWKRIEKEGIDPDSARGSVLRTQAYSRVLEACLKVRDDGAYCSIWKAIRRRDGAPVADVTEQVLALLPGILEGPVPRPIEPSTSGP
jgi:hypothetical protein